MKVNIDITQGVSGKVLSQHVKVFQGDQEKIDKDSFNWIKRITGPFIYDESKKVSVRTENTNDGRQLRLDY